MLQPQVMTTSGGKNTRSCNLYRNMYKLRLQTNSKVKRTRRPMGNWHQQIKLIKKRDDFWMIDTL